VTLLTCLALLIVCGTSYYLLVSKVKLCFLETVVLIALALAAGIGFMQFLTGYVDFNPVSRTVIWAIALLQLLRIYKIFVGLYDSPVNYENQ